MLFEVIKIILIIIFLLLVLYLLAIMPKLRRNPVSTKLDGWFYAHRGLHNNMTDAPENSLKSFAHAVEHGYGIELDVQLTKDLIPVVLHDYNLKRACGKDIKVADLTYDELKAYKLFKSQERIPVLKEVLELVDGKVPLIIELKIPWGARKLCEAVAKLLEQYQGLYCIESFNPFGLVWYRRNKPSVVRGQLSTDFAKEKIAGTRLQHFLLKHLLLNFLTKPDFIAYQHGYRKDLSFAVCRLLYRVKTVAWTIKSQKDYENNRRYFKLFIFESFIPESAEE